MPEATFVLKELDRVAKLCLVTFFLIGAYSCSGKQNPSKENTDKNVDTVKLSRIINLFPPSVEDVRPNQTILRDTVSMKVAAKEPTEYQATFDSTKKLLYLFKTEAIDTAKNIIFYFHNDSLLMIYYFGMPIKQKNIHWSGLLFLENNKIISQDSNIPNEIDLTGEIADAYIRRDFFYKKLNEIK